MSKFKYVAAAAASALILSACDLVEDTNNSGLSGDATELNFSLRSQIVGGASGVCSSAGQSACNNWDEWAAENLSEEQIANAALSLTEPVELTEAKIAALVADESWSSDPDFQSGVELILNHLRDELIADGVNPPEYEDWNDFRAAFIAVTSEHIVDLPEDVDGDAIWFDSTSAQYATFESLKKADERLNYTVTTSKIEAAKAIITALPENTLDQDQLAIDEVLDALLSENTVNQDELIAAIRSVPLEGNVVADGNSLVDRISDADFDILYDDWYNFNGYLLNQEAIDYLAARNWESIEHRDEAIMILDEMLESLGETDYDGSWSSGARADFVSVLISEGYENGGQLWNALSAELRFRLLEELVDSIPDYQRSIEYVSLADTENQSSIAVIEDFIAQAKLAGDTETPHILVMTSSSANSYAAADYYVGMFTHLGATAEWLPLDRAYRKARDANQCDWLSAYHSAFASAAHLDLLYPDYFQTHEEACENGLVDVIASADGIFINGGDQVRTFYALVTFEGENRVNSAELTQILDRQAAGELVIGGTSAGAAVQSGGLYNGQQNPMITSGSAHSALKSGYNSNSHEATGGIETFQWGVVDTHFSERVREARLIRLLAHSNVRFGFGVDETTALNTALVKEEGKADKVVMTVVGASGVYIVDMDESHVMAESPFEVRDVVTHYLNAGDSFVYYPESGDYEVIFATGSSSVVLNSNVETMVTSDNIFNHEVDEDVAVYKNMVNEMLSQGATTATGTSKENDPTYEVVIEATDDTAVVSNNGRLSYSNMKVKIMVQAVAP